VRIVYIGFSLALMTYSVASAVSPSLVLQEKIPLGEVKGRIDHLSIDVTHQRLFVADLGNDSVGVVDLRTSAVTRTLSGFDEPQGLAYAPSTDTLYVASGGDGTLRAFHGPELAESGRVKLGEDADNVRIDDGEERVYVGYGNGALAVLDAKTLQRVADIPLKAHPESFQLEKAGSRIFINVPDAHELAVLDRRANKQVASWPSNTLRANFPMALDESHQQVLAVFRHPAKLLAFSVSNGENVAAVDTCGDADDVFIDSRRSRVYVICGEGIIHVLSRSGATFLTTERVRTVSGARTALYSPALDRLFVAVRASAAESAAVWIFRPVD
jgi:YVTN family beta-propeller protein